MLDFVYPALVDRRLDRERRDVRRLMDEGEQLLAKILAATSP
jgi:hypothetical protein